MLFMHGLEDGDEEFLVSRSLAMEINSKRKSIPITLIENEWFMMKPLTWAFSTVGHEKSSFLDTAVL